MHTRFYIHDNLQKIAHILGPLTHNCTCIHVGSEELETLMQLQQLGMDGTAVMLLNFVTLYIICTLYIGRVVGHLYFTIFLI